jgi:DNA mismatch repair protein MutS2
MMKLFNGGMMRQINDTPDELDLHGLTVSEALLLVDPFIRNSARAGLKQVWIIHGRGTGALRQAVRHYLTHQPLIKSCSTAEKNRGGIGATRVEL